MALTDLSTFSNNNRLVKERIMAPVFKAILPDNTKAATTTTYTIGRIPPNSLVTGVYFIVDDAFDGTGYTLDIGYTGDTDGFKDNLDVRSAGVSTGTVHQHFTDYTNVVVTPTISGTPTKGSVRVVIEYIEINATDKLYSI